MWKQKLGISVGMPDKEQLQRLKAGGFDAVSPAWHAAGDLAAVCAAARECGLALQSLHAPFDKAALLWSADEAVSAPALAEQLAALEDCARCGIPVMVAHVWIGFEYSFDPGNLYFGNFDALAARAAALGVKLAFENTEGEEYLFALLEHFQDETAVGFCWDSGHELCYNHGQDLLAKYGSRLLVTHLNDNLGISRFDGATFWTDDLHLLPYDGIADWEDNIRRLRASAPLEYLNFELGRHSKPNRHENDVYAQMPDEVYYAEAYKRACRIASRYAK